VIRKKNPHLLRDLLLLTVCLGGLFFSFLGNRPLAAPDEGRYVEIPREMVESGDYITPRLNGLKYFEKPPLQYWIQTIPLRFFGMHEWAMRLPLAVLALLGCLLTYFFTQRFYDRRTGLWAAGILGTSVFYNVLGRLITLDMGLSVFLTGTLFSFLTATEEEDPWKRRLWMFLSAFFAACAVLSKGLIGVVLPGMIIFFWLLLTNNWRILQTLFLPSTFTVFMGIAGPWHVLASLKNPGFFDFYFIHEHFERYLTTVHRRHQPLWFFIPVVLLGMLPWASLLPTTLARVFPRNLAMCRKNPRELFFLLWAIVPFVFFSISNSKLIPYILPVFPALAVLMARRIETGLANKESFKAEIFGFSGLCFILIGGLTFALLELEPDLKIVLHTPLIFLYVLLGLSAALVPIARFWHDPLRALLIMLLTGVLMLQVLIMAAPLVPRLSIKPLAEKFLSIMPKETEVFTCIGYYQDLPPYLGRTVKIVEWHGELAFGAAAEPHQTQIVSYKNFEGAWRGTTPVCVFARQDRYNDLMQKPWFTPVVLGTHDGQILACNGVPEGVISREIK
jgi:4-amino-4-deoxy-L-arabinose transferase-like glycosyltransferase